MAVVAMVAVVVLASCSRLSKDERKPNPSPQAIDNAIQTKVLWSKSFDLDETLSNNQIKVYGDQVLAAFKNEVYLLDSKDGSLLWRKTIEDDEVIFGGAIQEALVVVATKKNRLLAFKKTDGTLLWQSEIPSRIYAPITLSSDSTWVRGSNGVLYKVGNLDGKIVWQYAHEKTPISIGSKQAPVIIKNRIFIALDNGKVLSIKTTDLKNRNQYRIFWTKGSSSLEKLATMRLTAFGKYLIVTSFNHDFAIIDTTTNQIQTTPLSSLQGVVLTDNTLPPQALVVDSDGVLWSVEVGNLNQKLSIFKDELLQFRQSKQGVWIDGKWVLVDDEGMAYWLEPSMLSSVDEPSEINENELTHHDKRWQVAAKTKLGSKPIQHLLELKLGTQTTALALLENGKVVAFSNF